MSAENFKVALCKAFEDSYQRTSGFDEMATAFGSMFRETDVKMKRFQMGIEGKQMIPMIREFWVVSWIYKSFQKSI